MPTSSNRHFRELEELHSTIAATEAEKPAKRQGGSIIRIEPRNPEVQNARCALMQHPGLIRSNDHHRDVMSRAYTAHYLVSAE